MFSHMSPLRFGDAEASHKFLEPINFHQGGETELCKTVQISYFHEPEKAEWVHAIGPSWY